MVLNQHDLQQIDADYLAALSPKDLLAVSLKLLQDLQEAHDRFNQTPANSSRSSGSFAPWEGTVIENEDEDASKDKNTVPESDTAPEEEEKAEHSPAPQKPGRQKGTKGQGSKTTREITGVEEHRAKSCALGGKELEEEAEFKSCGGFLVLDIGIGEKGIEVTHVKHLYGETLCTCGHKTRIEPYLSKKEENWQTALTERRLVGPMLAALIVSLSFRSSMSRMRIK